MKQILCAIAFLAAIPFAPPLFAQADGEDTFVPTNPPPMTRLTDFNSPAWRAAKMFMHGVNLGNYLEVPDGEGWGVTVSASEFPAMKREGFDHVRVPICWNRYVGPAPDFALSPGIFSRADFVVTNALDAGLAVIINIHDFNELDDNPAAAADEFIQIWRQVAAHYQSYPGRLAFELDNEPHKNATTAVMNPLYTRVIAEIRKSNPDRIIFVEPGNWGSISQLKNLVLPPDDRLIVSVHCYDPFLFTHQGASWTGLPKVTGIQFPGPPAKPFVPDPSLHLPQWMLDWYHEYNTEPADKNPCSPRAFEGHLKYARAWSDYYGRPVHLGEFGSFTTADPASRAHFYAAFRRALGQDRIGWAIWDWSAGFRYWDKENNQPMPGMREALFGHN